MRKLLLTAVTAIFLLTACNPSDNYGKKVKIKKSEVFYKDGATEDEAQALGDYLLEIGWFDAETKKSAQLVKEEDEHVVRLVVDKDKLEENEKALNTLWLMQLGISQHVFDKEPIKMVLVDTKLKDIQEMDPIAEYKAAKDAFIDYNNGAYKKADVKKLADAFKSQGFFSYEGEKTILLNKENGANVVRLLVNKETIGKSMDAFLPIYQMLLYTIKEEAFGGKKTAMYLTAREDFEDFKKIPVPTEEEIQQIKNAYNQTHENTTEETSTETEGEEETTIEE